jgi:hypothetical protein
MTNFGSKINKQIVYAIIGAGICLLITGLGVRAMLRGRSVEVILFVETTPEFTSQIRRELESEDVIAAAVLGSNVSKFDFKNLIKYDYFENVHGVVRFGASLESDDDSIFYKPQLRRVASKLRVHLDSKFRIVLEKRPAANEQIQ